MNQTYSPEARAPRGKAIPIAVLIGAVSLAVVAAILAISIFGGGPNIGANPTEPPGPSATSTVEPSSEPSVADSATPTHSVSASPSASPPANPIASIPDGLLPAGSLITVTGDGVRIREEPSTDADIVTTMSAGDFAYVVDRIDAGPVRLDGYDWYKVEYSNGEDVWPWQDIFHGDLYGGWMAAGTTSERFVELAEVRCGDEPASLERLAFDIKPWDRLVCLSAEPFTIEGTYGCDGCGGVTPGASPTWLADATQHPPIAAQFAYYPFIQVAVPPETQAPEPRDIVRATVHVDDPAAATCTYTPDPEGTQPTLDYDPVAVQIFCRERLVLESFEVIGTDDADR